MAMFTERASLRFDRLDQDTYFSPSRIGALLQINPCLDFRPASALLLHEAPT